MIFEVISNYGMSSPNVYDYELGFVYVSVCLSVINFVSTKQDIS